MKRIVLFLLTNIAVVVVAGITLNLLGVGHFVEANGLNYYNLLVFCLVFGMVGSLISLLLSKPIAKMATGTRVIRPNRPDSNTEAWLLDTVSNLANQANIGMPEVGIFPANEANAFATGWNKNSALVSVSSGLLDRYTRAEIEAVLAHEISHVANGDMVTLALIQGVVNAFVMFIARVVGYAIDRLVFKNENGVGFGFYAVVFVCEIIFGILASAVVMWFSRKREYRADEGAAFLVGTSAMIAALSRIQSESAIPTRSEMPQSLNAFAINEKRSSGFSVKSLFMSHPPLDKRIEALRAFSQVS